MSDAPLHGSSSDGSSFDYDVIVIGSGAGGGKSIVLRLTVDYAIWGVGMLFAIIMGAVGGFLPTISVSSLRSSINAPFV